MKEEKIFLSVIDYTQSEVIFTQQKWKIKCQTHPYLKLPQFKKFILIALTNPTEVWEDYDNPKTKRCYYYKYSASQYVKVVVWIASVPRRVVTAYSLDYIKEINYSHLKRLI